MLKALSTQENPPPECPKQIASLEDALLHFHPSHARRIPLIDFPIILKNFLIKPIDNPANLKLIFLMCVELNNRMRNRLIPVKTELDRAQTPNSITIWAIKYKVLPPHDVPIRDFFELAQEVDFAHVQKQQNYFDSHGLSIANHDYALFIKTRSNRIGQQTNAIKDKILLFHKILRRCVKGNPLYLKASFL